MGNSYQIKRTLDEMQDHYMKLLQKQTVCNSFNNEKIKLRNKLNLDQLNKPFDLEEIKQGIKRLKTKKAPGIDCISSEMIKCSNNALLSKITKLFNLIFDFGYYPETWNHGLIHSIHKSGSKLDRSNYRGITLLSSLGKLFSSLIYNRIENEIESKDILSPSQAGFRKNCRTTDHIFTLFSLLKKSISKGKYFYIRFVDFRKAYDSTCRKRLLYKLEETGLIGKILDIIKSIYKSPKGSLIHQEFIRQTFLTTISLKQGDVLSTILLNIYINDLSRRLLENSRSPDTVNDLPYLDDTKINNLLFADDLANFSLSKEEL